MFLLQDVSTRIMQFAQHGPRAMCVLSANGAISNVTLRQQSSSGGTVTYEVCFHLHALLSDVLHCTRRDADGINFCRFFYIFCVFLMEYGGACR